MEIFKKQSRQHAIKELKVRITEKEALVSPEPIRKFVNELSFRMELCFIKQRGHIEYTP